MTKYDSKVDTLAHIARVNALGKDFMTILTWQIKKHDASKLEGIEKKTFDEIRPLLKEFAYGSPEYTESLNKMRKGIDAHYKNNSHHPEHYAEGISGMDLFDIVEMFLDWKAASEYTLTSRIAPSTIA